MKLHSTRVALIALAASALAAAGCDKRNRAEVKTAVAAAAEARKSGDRAAVKHALESVSRAGAPLNPEEQSDLALAQAGLALEPELELAKQKRDIEGLFLALAKIERASFLSSTEAELLGSCRQALSELQAMRSHQAKHNHESVVHAADVILTSFPDNVEARRAFSESGLLLAYLDRAREAISRFSNQPDTTTQAAAEAALKAPLANVELLIEVNRCLADALKLDPQHPESLAMQAGVRNTQNLIAGHLAEVIGDVSTTAMRNAELAIIVAVSLVDQGKSAQSTRGIPSFWERYKLSGQHETLRTMLLLEKEKLGGGTKDLAQLKAMRNEENADLIDGTVRMVEGADAILEIYFKPAGSWPEFSDRIDRSKAIAGDLKLKHSQTISRYRLVMARGIEAMKALSPIEPYRDADRTKAILTKRKELLTTQV